MTEQERELNSIVARLNGIKKVSSELDLNSLAELLRQVKGYSKRLEELKVETAKIKSNEKVTLASLLTSYGSKESFEFNNLLTNTITLVNTTITLLEKQIYQVESGVSSSEIETSILEKKSQLESAVLKLEANAIQRVSNEALREMVKPYLQIAKEISDYGHTLESDYKTENKSVETNYLRRTASGEIVKVPRYASQEVTNFNKRIAGLIKRLNVLSKDASSYPIKSVGSEKRDDLRSIFERADVSILVDIARSKRLQVYSDMLNIQSLIDELMCGAVPSIPAKSLKEVLEQLMRDGQQKVSFGVLSRKYIVEYTNNTLGYKLTENLDIARGFSIDFCGRLFGRYS